MVVLFVISTVVTGLFGLFILNLRINQEAEQRVVAIALANERAETIRNLPFDLIGTVGGIPAGSILQQENVLRNNATFVVETDIRYVDDPFDGTATTNPVDTVNADYKQARIEVSWSSRYAIDPIVLIVTITPPGVEGGAAAGTLVFQAIDAAGVGVPSATVTLTNTTTNPQVNITTQTNESGELVLPGLPAADSSYEITVTKSGFTSEQTYDPTATFTPDLEHSHLSATPGQITSKTFAIDRVSALNVTTREQSLTGSIIPDVQYSLQGTKTIGTNDQGQPVYVLSTTGQTGASGTASHANLVWDTYTIAIAGQPPPSTIRETSHTLPLAVNPNQAVDLVLALAPYTSISLRVTVTNPAGQPVPNASVNLKGYGYNETLVTSAVGQVYFPLTPADPLPRNDDYDLEITATGFQDYDEEVTVNGTTTTTVALTPAGI
jgi:hypothetical protein